MGDLMGLDASFEYCNNIKLLIKCKANNMNLKPIKIITNRSIYKLIFTHCEGEINEIVGANFRMDNIRYNLKE